MNENVLGGLLGLFLGGLLVIGFLVYTKEKAEPVPIEVQTAELSKAHALIEEVFRVSIEDDFTSYTIPVTVSAYTARVEECDATPEVTADMTPSRIGLLAVSRDLIQDMGLKFGDVVMLVDHGFSLGVFTIRDVMNSRYRNRVDILHSLPEAARLFGVKEGVLLVRIVGDS